MLSRVLSAAVNGIEAYPVQMNYGERVSSISGAVK
jgi:hypothetical protein